MTAMPDSTPQRTSAAYRLAAIDPDFLLGESTRGVRFQLEYLKAQEHLQAFGIRSTIVVFGSARVMEHRVGNHARWYSEARAFGRIASERGGALNAGPEGRFNVIATGGGPGFMEAANRGASEAGAPTIGFNITLPHEQEPNAYTTPELTFRFHYFAMRKMHLAMHAAALVVFPGGFGTLDELFEIVTLRQTGKMPFCPIILMDRAYWDRLINLDVMIEEEFIRPEDRGLYAFADTAEEAWALLEQQGLAVP
jgi:uncharacterized protein (TIGR00730 family)